MRHWLVSPLYSPMDALAIITLVSAVNHAWESQWGEAGTRVALIGLFLGAAWLIRRRVPTELDLYDMEDELELTEDDEVRVLWNSNVTMTRGKMAAQAVHAVLFAYGIPHGRVVVLGGNPTEIEAMPATVRDAGLTEVEPGTLTAGARIVSA